MTPCNRPPRARPWQRAAIVDPTTDEVLAHTALANEIVKEVIDAAYSAFHSGLHAALYLSAGLALAAGLLSVVISPALGLALLRRVRPVNQTHPPIPQSTNA